jgi:hypothetical protein
MIHLNKSQSAEILTLMKRHGHNQRLIYIAMAINVICLSAIMLDFFWGLPGLLGRVPFLGDTGTKCMKLMCFAVC